MDHRPNPAEFLSIAMEIARFRSGRQAFHYCTASGDVALCVPGELTEIMWAKAE
jgi:hypothetical protein